MFFFRVWHYFNNRFNHYRSAIFGNSFFYFSSLFFSFLFFSLSKRRIFSAVESFLLNRTRTQVNIVQFGHVRPIPSLASDHHVPYAAVEVIARHQRSLWR